MIDFIQQNMGNIIVGGLLLLAVVLILRSRAKKKKAGENSCGCGCSGCPSSEICHTPKNEEQKN